MKNLQSLYHSFSSISALFQKKKKTLHCSSTALLPIPKDHGLVLVSHVTYLPEPTCLYTCLEFSSFWKVSAFSSMLIIASRLKNTSSRMHDTIITFLLHKLYPPELSPRHDIRTSSPRVLHNTRLHNLKPSPLIKRPQTKVSAQRIFGNCISPHHRAPQKVE